MSRITVPSLEELITDCLEFRPKLKLEQLARCIWEGQDEVEKLELNEIKIALEKLVVQGLIQWDVDNGWISLALRDDLVTTHSRVFRKSKVWVLGHYPRINSKHLYENLEIQNSISGDFEHHFVDVTKECMLVWVYDSVKCESYWGEEEFRISCRISGYPPHAFTEYAMTQTTYSLEKLSEIPQTTCAYLLFNEMRKELARLFNGIEITVDEFEVLESRQ